MAKGNNKGIVTTAKLCKMQGQANKRAKVNTLREGIKWCNRHKGKKNNTRAPKPPRGVKRVINKTATSLKT
jgi:hypothetical protein